MFSLFKRFKEGLKRTANGALGKLAGLFSKKIDPSDIALIEETLIEADFGYETVCEIIDAIKSEYKRDSQLQGRRAAQGSCIFDEMARRKRLEALCVRRQVRKDCGSVGMRARKVAVACRAFAKGGV